MNRIVVDIPESTVGDWQIKRVVGDSSNIYALAYDRSIGGPDGEPYGTYTFMTRTQNGKKFPVMEDTHARYAEHQTLWDKANGDVLIGGLGLGFVNYKLIQFPHVTSVTIVEKNQEIIDMVWSHCPKDERFSIVHADIDTWTPPIGSHWNYAWLDTWIAHNSIQNRQQYNHVLMEKYLPFCDEINYWNP